MTQTTRQQDEAIKVAFTDVLEHMGYDTRKLKHRKISADELYNIVILEAANLVRRIKKGHKIVRDLERKIATLSQQDMFPAYHAPKGFFKCPDNQRHALIEELSHPHRRREFYEAQGLIPKEK